MIADKNLANPDAFPNGTVTERFTPRSEAKQIMQCLAHYDAKMIALPDALMVRVTELIEEYANSGNERRQELAVTMTMKANEHNRKMAEQVSRGMVEEKQPVNVNIGLVLNIPAPKTRGDM